MHMHIHMRINNILLHTTRILYTYAYYLVCILIESTRVLVVVVIVRE